MNNLIDFYTQFPTEQAAIDYVTAQRWEGNVICPHCQHEKCYTFAKYNRFKCAKCRTQFTARTGTIFEESRLPLQKWLLAAYLLSSHKKGISSCQLAKDLDITQKTAWFMLHRLRLGMEQGSFVLGENRALPLVSETSEVKPAVIEADETYVGGKEKNKHASKRRKGTQGRSTKTKAAVVGLVERNGRVVCKPVPDVTKEMIQAMLRRYITAHPTILMTDSLASYQGTHYDHRVINHAQGEYVRGDVHTNTIEGFWSQLKRSIFGIYHQVSKKHLNAYCTESSFRYNTRQLNEAQRLTQLFKQSEGKRVTYQQLIMKKAA